MITHGNPYHKQNRGLIPHSGLVVPWQRLITTEVINQLCVHFNNPYEASVTTTHLDWLVAYGGSKRKLYHRSGIETISLATTSQWSHVVYKNVLYALYTVRLDMKSRLSETDLMILHLILNCTLLCYGLKGRNELNGAHFKISFYEVNN